MITMIRVVVTAGELHPYYHLRRPRPEELTTLAQIDVPEELLTRYHAAQRAVEEAQWEIGRIVALAGLEKRV